LFATILEIMTKIRHALAAITLFDIAFTVIFYLWETTWVAVVFGLSMWFLGTLLDIKEFIVGDVKEFIIWVNACIVIDILVPEPGQSYHSFKRLFILRFLAWIYKKRHFKSTSSVDALANYYQNLSKAVLQKYYTQKQDDVQKLKLCIVDKIRDDKLPTEKEEAICNKLNLLEQYDISKKFDKIFEEYKKEMRKL